MKYKSIIDIRYRNLLSIVEKFKSPAELSTTLDRHKSFIAKYLRNNDRAPIGYAVARLIEDKAEIPTNWMDHDHTYDEEVICSLKKKLLLIGLTETQADIVTSKLS